MLDHRIKTRESNVEVQSPEGFVAFEHFNTVIKRAERVVDITSFQMNAMNYCYVLIKNRCGLMTIDIYIVCGYVHRLILTSPRFTLKMMDSI